MGTSLGQRFIAHALVVGSEWMFFMVMISIFSVLAFDLYCRWYREDRNTDGVDLMDRYLKRELARRYSNVR